MSERSVGSTTCPTAESPDPPEKMSPTGRWIRVTQSEPNLQQIPIRTEEGRRIREALIKWMEL